MSAFDLTTGFELELCLPAPLDRLDLAERLGAALGARVERFEFPSKVPVPSAPTPAAVIARIEDVARHHAARIVSVSKDYRFFFLAHRAARIVDDEGRVLASVVHDNSLPGGERVAEIVTRPLLRGELDELATMVEVAAAIEGVSLPPSAALHVHFDGAPFVSPAPLARLAALYARHEASLRVLARSPPAFTRAAALPAGLIEALSSARTWEESEAALRAHVPHRGFALNLYNLAAGEPNKLTVELKLAAATLALPRILALRALYLALAERALAGDEALPEAPAALAEALIGEAAEVLAG